MPTAGVMTCTNTKEKETALPTNWKFICDGNLKIGAGSYWTDDPNVYLELEDVNNVGNALRKVEEYESGGNPIIIWQIECNGKMRALRQEFLKKSGQMSAVGFAQHTADFLAGRGESGHTVYANFLIEAPTNESTGTPAMT